MLSKVQFPDVASSPEIIQPFILACRSTREEAVAVSIGGLHHLISDHALHPNWVPQVVQTLKSLLARDIDQNTTLRLLQCAVRIVCFDVSLSCFLMPDYQDGARVRPAPVCAW